MKAIYPGTFDPITYGHIDIIKRASIIFDEVIVAVAENREKKPLFSLPERVAMVKDSIRSLSNVRVDSFDNLVVDYAKKKGARVMIRGMRMISDFEYEFQMALTNRKLSGAVETIFMVPHEKYSYVSSKLIKEAAFLGANLKAFVPKKVETALKKKVRM